MRHIGSANGKVDAFEIPSEAVKSVGEKEAMANEKPFLLNKNTSSPRRFISQDSAEQHGWGGEPLIAEAPDNASDKYLQGFQRNKLYAGNGSGGGSNGGSGGATNMIGVGGVGGGSPSITNRRLQHKPRGKHNYNQTDSFHRNMPRPTYPEGQAQAWPNVMHPGMTPWTQISYATVQYPHHHPHQQYVIQAPQSSQAMQHYVAPPPPPPPAINTQPHTPDSSGGSVGRGSGNSQSNRHNRNDMHHRNYNPNTDSKNQTAQYPLSYVTYPAPAAAAATTAYPLGYSTAAPPIPSHAYPHQWYPQMIQPVPTEAATHHNPHQQQQQHHHPHPQQQQQQQQQQQLPPSQQQQQHLHQQQQSNRNYQMPETSPTGAVATTTYMQHKAIYATSNGGGGGGGGGLRQPRNEEYSRTNANGVSLSPENIEENGSKSSENTNNGVPNVAPMTPSESSASGYDPNGGNSAGQTLYVGNLALSVEERMLAQCFAPYGQIMNVQVIRDRDTHLSRGFAFVTYSHPSCAQLAMQHMDTVQLHGPFEGRRLKVSFSKRR